MGGGANLGRLCCALFSAMMVWWHTLGTWSPVTKEGSCK